MIVDDVDVAVDVAVDVVVGGVSVVLVEVQMKMRSFGSGLGRDLGLGLGSEDGRQACTWDGWRGPCVAGRALVACEGDEAREPWPWWCQKSLVKPLKTSKTPQEATPRERAKANKGEREQKTRAKTHTDTHREAGENDREFSLSCASSSVVVFLVAGLIASCWLVRLRAFPTGRDLERTQRPRGKRKGPRKRRTKRERACGWIMVD